MERTPRSRLPDPRAFIGRFIDATLEVLAGSRPLIQLMPLTNEIVYAELGAELRRRGRNVPRARPAPARLLRGSRPHVAEPADGVAEVTAMVQQQGRVRAVAVRIEGLDGRWRCTAWSLL